MKRTTLIVIMIITAMFNLSLVYGLGNYDYSDNVAPSQNPPGGLDPSQVPQFIIYGWDDNSISGYNDTPQPNGTIWWVHFFRDHNNPAGTGNPLTYDGQQMKASYFCATFYINQWGAESPVFNKRAWHEAITNGMDLGNHTDVHGHGSTYSLATWENEIDTCNTWLSKPFDPNESTGTPDSTKGVGADLNIMEGFRTPYLEYNDSTFTALINKGFTYDSSIEEGWQSDQDGGNYYWPYTLNGNPPSPGHTLARVGWNGDPELTPHPGLWEFPVYALIVPPDSECVAYGTTVGARARVKAAISYFDETSGKITGFDYNVFASAKMNRADAQATMKYSLDKRYNGNRAPYIWGSHGGYYSPKKDSSFPNANAADRMGAQEDFMNYALSKPDVRFVTFKEFLAWMRNPVPLGSLSACNVFFSPHLPTTITSGGSFSVTAKIVAYSNTSGVAVSISTSPNLSVSGSTTRNIGTMTGGSNHYETWTVNVVGGGDATVYLNVIDSHGTDVTNSETTKIVAEDIFDDFEDYTNTADLTNNWEMTTDAGDKGGTGVAPSTISETLDTSVVNGGSKAMKIDFNIINDAGQDVWGWVDSAKYIAESDWSKYEYIKFYMRSPNAGTTVDVGLLMNDAGNSGGDTVFTHSLTVANADTWQEFQLVLTNDFTLPDWETNQTTTRQIDLTKILGMTIDPTTEGVGVLYIDDISLLGDTTNNSGLLPPPNLISPANNEYTKDTTPTFVWNSVANATGYKIVLNGVTNSTTTTNYLSSSLSDGNYNWKVCAVKNTTNGTFSASRIIHIDTTPPTIVSLNSPTSNNTLATINATFSWNATTDSGIGVEAYIFQLDDNSDFSSPIITKNTNGLSYSTLLNDGTLYYWRVRAYDSLNNTNSWSSVWSVSVDTNQIIPTLISPTNNAIGNDTTPTFVWSNESDVDNYRIVVDSATQTTASTQATWTTLNEGNHTWKVQAHKQSTGQWQSWSSIYTYTIDTTLPNAPILSSPANGATISEVRPTFSWNSVADTSGIAYYNIVIDSTTYQSTTTTYTPISDLSVSGHTWKVQAVDNAGNVGNWSSVWSFTIDTNTPSDPAMVDSFEQNILFPNDNPYAPTNLADNNLNGYWYCNDDQGEPFTTAKHSRAMNISVTADAADSTSKALVTSFTLGVSDSGSDEWGYWEIDCTLSSNDTEQNLTSKTLDFWMKGNSAYSANVVLTPNDTKAANNYGYNLYKHSINVTTSWQHIVLPIDSSTFAQDTGWGTTVPFTTAVTEVVAFAWSVDAPETGSPTYHEMYLDQIRLSPALVTQADTTAPTIPSLISPADNVWTNDNTPTFTWSASSDSDSGVAGYDIVIDSSTNSVSGTTYTPGSGLSEGLHTWKVRARDNAGNKSVFSTSRVIKIDTINPGTPGLSSPSDGSTVSSPVSFSWSASSESGSGIAYYIVDIDDTGSSFGSIIRTTNVTGTSVSLTLGSGTFYWRVRGYDNAGNISSYQSRSFTINTADTSPPSIPSLVSPANNSWVTNSKPTFVWNTSTDDVGVIGYIIDIDGTTNNVGTTNYTPSVSLSEGIHQWRVTAKDAAGNTNWSSIWTVNIDTSDPGITSLSSPTNNIWTNDNTPTFSWSSASDTGSGVARYDIDIAGSIYDAGSGTSYTPSSGLSEGANTWRVRAIDNAGNVGNWTTAYTVNIDTSAPGTPTLSNPVNNAWMNDNTPTFTWSSVSDTGSGVARYDIEIAGTVYDVGNNTSYTPISVLSDGANLWRVRAIDNVGNVGSWSSRTVNIDTAVPSIVNLSSPANNSTNGSTSITFVWNNTTDSGSGVDRYIIQIDDDSGFNSINYTKTTNSLNYIVIGLTPNTTYYWRVLAYDNAGNTNSWSTVWNVTVNTNVVDTTAPSIPGLVSPADNIWTNNNKPTFVWNASTDSGSGVASYDIVIDSDTNSVTGTSYIPVTGLNEGSHTWMVRAIDNAGNKSDFSGSQTIKIDTTAPTTPALSSPADGASVSSPVSFSWSASSESGSGMAYYTVDIDNTSSSFSSIVKTTNVTGTSVSLNLSGGTYYWRVRAYDNAENVSGAQSRSFSISTPDITSPSIPNLVSPANNSWVTNNKPTFVWNTSTDNVGVTGYTIEIDGGIHTVGTTNYTPSVSLSEGIHQWRVTAKDAAGNTNWSSVWTVQIDTSAPNTPTLNSPSDGVTTNDATPTFSWNSVSDTGSGVTRYEIEIDSTIYDAGNSASYTPSTGLTNGNYHWRVRAVDVAGNIGSWSSQWSLIIDTTVPDTENPLPPTIFVPANGYETTDTTPQLSWGGASDNVGIFGYDVEIDGKIVATNLTSSTYIVENALNVGEHTWRIRVKDTSINSVWSSSQTLIVKSEYADQLAPNTFRITPNPFTKDDTLLIEYNTENADDEVEFIITTLVGTHVVTITPDEAYRAHWDAKNSFGKTVASGIYFAIMKVNGRVVFKPLKIGYINK